MSDAQDRALESVAAFNARHKKFTENMGPQFKPRAKEAGDDFPEEAFRAWWDVVSKGGSSCVGLTERHTFSRAARWAWARRSEEDRYRPTEADMNAQERNAQAKVKALEGDCGRLMMQANSLNARLDAAEAARDAALEEKREADIAEADAVSQLVAALERVKELETAEEAVSRRWTHPTVAEGDALEARVKVVEVANNVMRRERDALKAEVARLREAIKEAVDELDPVLDKPACYFDLRAALTRQEPK